MENVVVEHVVVVVVRLLDVLISTMTSYILDVHPVSSLDAIFAWPFWRSGAKQKATQPKAEAARNTAVGPVSPVQHHLGGGFKDFLFSPRKLGKIPILTNIFQRG